MTENLKYIKDNCYAVMFRLNVIVLVECLRGAKVSLKMVIKHRDTKLGFQSFGWERL